MRNLIILMAVIFGVALLPGCGRRPSAQREAMALAESLMDSLPDSALTIMQGVALPADAPEEDRALRALLLSQALDKNYQDVESDTLIALADSFYRATSDTRRQMLAAFYHGRVLFNAKDYPHALRLFTEALELATSLSDPFWQARAASELSDVYKKCYHRVESVYYAEMACELFRKSNRQPFLNHAILELGRTYNNLGEDDKAQQVIKAAIDSAVAINDLLLHREANLLLAHSYLITQKYDSCINLIEGFTYDSKDSLTIRALLGEAYLRKGNLEVAKSFLPDASRKNLSAQEFMFLNLYYKQTGDWKHAMVASDSALRQTDKILTHSLDQTFAQTLRDYYSAEQEVRELKLRNARLSNIILIIVFVLIGVILLYLFIRVYSHFKHVRANLESETRVLRKDIEKKQIVIDDKRAKLQSLLSVKYDIFNQLCQVYYENQSNDQLPEILTEAFKESIDGFSDENKIIAELGQLLDVYFDNVFTH